MMSRLFKMIALLSVLFLFCACDSSSSDENEGEEHESPSVEPSGGGGGGAWVEAGTLSALYSFSFTTLNDGAILAVGGRNGEYMASASIFDPTADTWADSASMSGPRANHSATRLSDGRVLVVGGEDRLGHDLLTAEIFDPSGGTWTATGSMTQARSDHQAVLLNDGRLLVVGGVHMQSHCCEIFDPAAGTWTDAGAWTNARRLFQAALLSDGRVMIAGGFYQLGSDSAYLDSVEIYDPPTNTWSVGPALATGRSQGTVTALADGRVLVAGGQAQGSDPSRGPDTIRSTEIYDPATNAWSAGPELESARRSHHALLLASGDVFVSGGEGAYTSIEVFSATAGSFSSFPSFSAPRVNHQAIQLTDGRVLVAGPYFAEVNTVVVTAESP